MFSAVSNGKLKRDRCAGRRGTGRAKTGEQGVFYRMEKALIGVTPLYDENRGAIWMLPEYLKGVSRGGGIPVILPLSDTAEEARALARRLDGFLFTGGQDVDPALYDQVELPFCGKTSARRDAFEKALLAEILRLDKPVLGICRGLQLINVMLGGSLYQDIPRRQPRLNRLSIPRKSPTTLRSMRSPCRQAPSAVWPAESRSG